MLRTCQKTIENYIRFLMIPLKSGERPFHFKCFLDQPIHLAVTGAISPRLAHPVKCQEDRGDELASPGRREANARRYSNKSW